MTDRRYAFFASISLLLFGCVLSQKHTPLPLAFIPASGLSNSTSVSFSLTQAAAASHALVSPNETTNGQTSNNETPKSPTNTFSANTANAKSLANSKVTTTASSAVSYSTNKPSLTPQTKPANTQQASQKTLKSDVPTQQSPTQVASQQKKTTQHTTSIHTQDVQILEKTALSDSHSVESLQAQIKKTQEKPNPILPSMEVSQPKFAVPPTQPHYPKLARKKGFEGITTLEVLFDQAGKQLSLKLISSSGFNLLDKAALEAVKKWRFSAPNEQTAYTYKVRVPIKFSLN
ncbi:energy transducer TonB [uncultured Shewanella sp.]|uniref:energy transducer TonB n=1 Tax=uncultured Shewanella sp. TaxID=173975 RepID=UPI00263021D1|nr:energy transducer TonB [uncultured Shewanella sp.]